MQQAIQMHSYAHWGAKCELDRANAVSLEQIHFCWAVLVLLSVQAWTDKFDQSSAKIPAKSPESAYRPSHSEFYATFINKTAFTFTCFMKDIDYTSWLKPVTPPDHVASKVKMFFVKKIDIET